MKVGIVSDSHGKADRLRRALEELIRRGAEKVVHCGDVGSADCVEVLAGCGVEAYAVAGNMDRRPEELAQRARQLGVHFSLDTILVPIGEGDYLAATHGNDAAALSQLITAGRYRYVCHGHTHRRRDERCRGVHVINPGALHHTHSPTVALLETSSGTVEFVRVP